MYFRILKRELIQNIQQTQTIEYKRISVYFKTKKSPNINIRTFSLLFKSNQMITSSLAVFYQQYLRAQL